MGSYWHNYDQCADYIFYLNLGNCRVLFHTHTVPAEMAHSQNNRGSKGMSFIKL